MILIRAAACPNATTPVQVTASHPPDHAERAHGRATMARES